MVSSFRDRFNPEAVHFPASIQCKALIFSGALLVLLCLVPTYWVEQPIEARAIDTALVILALGFMLLAWPADLITDQFGLSSKSPWPHKRAFIAWKEVASVERRLAYGGRLSGLGIAGDFLIVYGADGRKLVHSPLHGDRARFEHELGIHGVAPDQAEDQSNERQSLS
jgi:hypothetical protein